MLTFSEERLLLDEEERISQSVGKNTAPMEAGFDAPK